MATNTLVPQRRSGASRTPSTPARGRQERAAAPRPGPAHDTSSETDAHLRRSYALVERLRRAVDARTAGLL